MHDASSAPARRESAGAPGAILTTVTYPRAYLAQDFAVPRWDGVGEPPQPFRGIGPLPAFERAWGYIDSGGESLEEGEWPSAEEAITWARQRVSVVLVRIGYSDYYSAGDEHPTGVPRWPPTEHAIRTETLRDA